MFGRKHGEYLGKGEDSIRGWWRDDTYLGAGTVFGAGLGRE